MTPRSLAEQHVRSVCKDVFDPEFSICSIHRELNSDCRICQAGWVSPQLQHWLRALEQFHCHADSLGEYGTVTAVEFSNTEPQLAPPRSVVFDLMTGQPATEADYQAYCDIIGLTPKP